MKNRASNAPPRRLATPQKPVRLSLRPRAGPEPENETDTQPTSSFWKWVGLIALVHVLLIVAIAIFYARRPPPPPEKQFFSLLPEGDTVHGQPGIQQASKAGPGTPAPAVHHPAAEPTPAEVTPPEPVAPPALNKPVAAKPAKPKHHAPKPKPIVKTVTPPPEPTPPPPTPPPTPVPNPLAPPPEPPAPPDKSVPDQPIVKTEVPPPAKPKPSPKPEPEKPQVKLSKNDLQLADGPETDAPDGPAVKSKPAHQKKEKSTAVSHDDSDAPDHDSATDSPSLTAAEIAAQIGSKLQDAGVKNSVKVGTGGEHHAKGDPFQAFYLSVRDQVMEKWDHPNLTDDTAVNPEVTIHVEKDGRVPPESVILTRSSRNQAYDDSALAAAKSLGYTLQPLPEGCPPDIHITFKLTR